MTQDDPAAIRSHHCPGQATGGPPPVIVVELDGSPASRGAFAWGAGEAVRSNGSLIAVYATPAVEPGAAFGGPFDYAAAEQARQEAARLLAAGATQLASEVGVPLSFVREPGGVTRALTCVAHSARLHFVGGGLFPTTLHPPARSAFT